MKALKIHKSASKQQAVKIIKSLTNMEDVSIIQRDDYIEVKKNPASVFVVVKNEKWTSSSTLYNEITQPFTSAARISHMSANEYGIGERAAKGIASRLLCIAMCILILNDKMTPRSIVVAEIDQSINDQLLQKVYTPLGFHLVSRFDSDRTGGLVKTYTRTIISKCKTTIW